MPDCRSRQLPLSHVVHGSEIAMYSDTKQWCTKFSKDGKCVGIIVTQKAQMVIIYRRSFQRHFKTWLLGSHVSRIGWKFIKRTINMYSHSLPLPVAFNVQMDSAMKSANDLPPQWQTRCYFRVLRAEGCEPKSHVLCTSLQWKGGAMVYPWLDSHQISLTINVIHLATNECTSTSHRT